MQDKNDPGFKLPAASGPAASAAASSPQMEVAPVAGAPIRDTSTRDVAIGGSVFLALLLAIFFARNAFVQHLVVRRVAPASASNAGWLMFNGLACVSGAAILAVMKGGAGVTATLVLVGLVSLVAALLVGRR